MSTTLNKLEYLDETKQQIKTALNQFGAGITDETTFREYADKIDDIYDNWLKVTGTGSLITLNNTKLAKMILELGGNTSQDGTPTPDNPVDIQVVKGSNSIKVENKNLMRYPYSTTTTTQNGVTFTDNGDGSITIKGTSTGDCYFNFYNNDVQNRLKLKAGTYTFSVDNTNISNIYIEFRLKDKNGDSIPDGRVQVNNSNKSVTKTINEDFEINSYIYIGSGNTFDLILYPMIEKGSSAISFVPHAEQTYSITLPSGMELCKIGDYQDYIYKNNGNWYKKSVITKITLNGTESGWSMVSQIGMVKFTIYNLVTNAVSNTNQLSTHFSNGHDIVNTFAIYTSFWFDIFTNEMTLQEFKTWLGNNNPVFYYPCTPTDTQITDTTLIGQLNTMEENLKSYNDQTNILQTNDDLPFIINASALKKGGN